jgi:hypothetical protein
MTDLRVTTAHVRELSARQGEAAAQLTTAATVTDGVSQSMWLSHGAICAVSNMAVAAAEGARKGACQAMSSVSADLDEKLTTAAQRYDEMDQANRRQLDERIHPC